MTENKVGAPHICAATRPRSPPFDPQSDGGRAIEEYGSGIRGPGWRLYVDLVKQSGVAWVQDRAPTMGAALASAYGAVGTLVVLLLWLYYSAQVFLFGAEFTCLYATHRTRSRGRGYSGSGRGSNK